MLLAVVSIVLYVLGLAQVIGGALGLFVGITGLRRIKTMTAGFVQNDPRAPAGAIQIEQRKGLHIVRYGGIALVLGLVVLFVAAWLTTVSAGF